MMFVIVMMGRLLRPREGFLFLMLLIMGVIFVSCGSRGSVVILMMIMLHPPQGNSRKKGDHPKMFSGSPCPEKVLLQREPQVEEAGGPGKLLKLPR
jgi:hypothetical protein